MAAQKNQINNAFYDILHEDWIHATDHPIALLRAENALRNPWIIKTIEEKKQGHCKILDVGCGAGLLTNPLAIEGHEVFGVDLSSSTLNVAQKLDSTKTISYQIARAESLPFSNATFDVVCAMDLLEHVQNPNIVLQEASRVLKPGGLFFFHTFNRNFISYLTIIKGIEWFVKNTPRHMHVYSLFITPKELKNQCKQHLLQIEEIKGIRPDILTKSFWKMLLTNTVDPDFRFIFTPSLLTGYIGFAIKH